MECITWWQNEKMVWRWWDCSLLLGCFILSIWDPPTAESWSEVVELSVVALNKTPLLKCVDSTEAKKILKEIHEESYGTHANGHAMAQKILRAGYYWLTMDNDCCEHVRKCHKCQTYANNIHAPLISLIAPWPFSMWGIDVIGPIELRASNGHRFILVTISPSGWRLLHMLMWQEMWWSNS